VIAVLDREKFIVARSRRPEGSVGQKASAVMQEQSRRKAQGVVDSVTLEGHPSIAAFRMLPESGWSVAVGGHKSELFEPAKQRLAIVLAVAIAVGTLALALALWVSHATEAVAEFVLSETQALARGERVEPQQTGIVEADTVSRALAETSQELIARQTALTQARDEALAASRAKDELLAALSHELRTPLNPVLLLASEGARNPAHPPAVRELLASIEKNVLQEARLIDDLLDLTRISAGKLAMRLEPVEIDPLVCDVVETLRPVIAEKRLDLRLRPGTSRARVHGDSGRLQQVFTNVLGNAVKFTPGGGVILVSTRLDGAAGLACVEISDSGIGLSEAELARIFEKFTQGNHARDGRHSQFGGLGLGLAISRRLVEMHGGKIDASSAGPGKGATFRIWLPAVA
jgi:signal transduction histidine kinase